MYCLTQNSKLFYYAADRKIEEKSEREKKRENKSVKKKRRKRLQDSCR